MALERIEVTPAKALAVYAHPDDGPVAAGGALARWAKDGCEVHLVVATDGAKGSWDGNLSPAALSAQRAEELEACVAALGIAACTQLGYPDGELDNDAALRATLVGIIRDLAPDGVLGHDPTAVFFGRHYVNHRDHRELGWALLDAVAPAAGQPHYFPGSGEGAHRVASLLLSGTLEADAAVAVGDVLDVKARAVAAHRSQFPESPEDLGEVVRLRAVEDGRRAGVEAAELFRLIELA